MPVAVQLGLSVHPDASRMLARVLAARFGVRGTWQVVSMEDVEALMRQTADAQAVGCSRREDCNIEVGDALGADMLVDGQLRGVGERLEWQASVTELKTSTLVRRVSLQARTLDALAQRADDLALMLLGLAPAPLARGRVAARKLGFEDASEFKTFARERAAHPELGLSEALTDHILAHNQESPRLMWAQAVTLLGSLAVLVAAGLGLPVTALVMGMGPPGALCGLGLGCVTALAGPAAIALSVTGAVLAVVDVLDLGRVSVREDGCCRDDARVASAQRPQRLARALAMASAVLPPLGLTFILLSDGLALPALFVGFLLATAVSPALGPLVPRDTSYIVVPLLCWAGNCLTLPFCALLACPVATGAGTLLTLWPSRPLLNDVEDAPAPRRARKATR